MTKRSRRRKARDRTKPTPAQETPVYNEEPPQAESPVYDDSGAPPFPNPAAAVAPPQPQPMPDRPSPFTPEVLAEAARLVAANRPTYSALDVPPVAVDPMVVMKKEHADLTARVNAMQYQFEQLRTTPIGPLTQAAGFVLDAANFVVQEYAKIGRTITLQQAVNLIVHTVAAAQRGNLAELLAAVAPGNK